MFASSTTTQSPIPRSLPQAYAEILNDLNQKVISAQPQDVLQFCANYFNQKLEEQRIRFLVQGKPIFFLTFYFYCVFFALLPFKINNQAKSRNG